MKRMNSKDMALATVDKKKCNGNEMNDANSKNSYNDGENPFDRLPLEMMVKMFKSISPWQVFKNRLVCRKFYDVSNKTCILSRHARFVIICDQTIYIRIADWQGNFVKEIDHILPLSEIWRLNKKPIEKLKILYTPLHESFCKQLYQLVKDHNIKVKDLYINSRWESTPKMKIDPITLYKVIEALEPKSLVLNVCEGLNQMTRQITEDKELTKKMDFLLISIFSFWLPRPKFLVELSDATIFQFIDYFACVKANHVGPYERIPSFEGPMFKIVPH